ncbi:MAG: Mrp/NBP35 family ATP-binding protein [Myxococcaceae bacterium]
MAISEAEVRDVLKTVLFPGLSRDILAIGFVKDLVVEGGDVRFRLELSSDAQHAANVIRAECEKKLLPLVTPHQLSIQLDLVPRVLARMPVPAPTPVDAAARARLAQIRFKVAVASGKGGVGKSTVTANLAVALARLGYKVGLMDLDIYGPSQQMMMGIAEKPFVDAEDGLLQPQLRHGVRVATLGALMEVDQPAVWRGPMVMKAVEQLLTGVRWGLLDFLLADLPPGTGDVQLTLTQKAALSGAVIVTTPQDVALVDARKGLAMFQKVGVRVLGLVENMASYACPACGHVDHPFKHGGGRSTAERLAIPFLGEIPLHPHIVEGGDAGTPIVGMDPDSVAAQAFVTAARAIAAAVGA